RMEAVLPDARTLPADSEVRRVEELVSDPAQFDPSGASAIQVVVSARGSLLEPRNLALVQGYLASLRAVPGISAVRTRFAELGGDGAPIDPARAEELEQRLARTVDRDLALVTAQGTSYWRSHEAGAAVTAIRALPHGDLDVRVGGPTALLVDIRGTLESYGALVALLVVAWNLVV